MAGNTLGASTGRIVSGTASNIAFYIMCQFRQPTAGATTGVQMRIGLEGAFTNPLPAEIQQSVTLTLWRDTTSYGSDISYNFEKSNPGSSYSQWSSWMTISGLTHTTGTDSFRIHYSSNGMFYSSGWMYTSGQLYWTEDSGGGGSTTTYTKCIAPTVVKVGASTSYTANSSVYNTTAPTPGQFYITWNAGTAGENMSIAGYTRRVENTLGGNVYTADTTSGVRYSLSNNWTTAAVGYSYKCQVKTRSSVSSTYDSDYSSSYGTVIFSASAVTSTLVLDPEGGSIEGSTSNKTINITLGNLLDLPVPIREGYNFKGWYYNSNATNYMNLGTYYMNAGSFSVSFWSYADSYQGTSTQTMISCMQSGGWVFYGNGTNWRFQVHDGSGYKAVTIPKASISDGYHYWCGSFDATNHNIKLWLDGVLMGTTSTSTSYSDWKMPSSKGLLLGDEWNGTNGDGTGFIGKLGNLVISGNPGLYEPAPTEFMSPGTTYEYTLHAAWEKGRYWYIYNGSKWRKALPYIYNGSGWEKAMTYVYNGSTWQ